MQLIPDWAPNIHPMIIHFPLVLLIVAVLFDALGLIIKKSKQTAGISWLEKSALVLYLFGTITLVAAFLTGRSAEDGLNIPSHIIPALSDHADWAEITLWFFIIYTAVRFTASFVFKPKILIVLPLVLIGFVGIYFLYQTGDKGAKLVFGYGLGTGNLMTELVGDNDVHTSETITDTSFIIIPDGSWTFITSPAAIEILRNKFDWVKNSIADLNSLFDTNNNALMFHPSDEVMFIQKGEIGSIEMKVELNLDDFNGEIELIHHYTDNNNYDFLRIVNGKIALARKSNGQIRIFEEGSYPEKGWIEVKKISDRTHFRGYVNDKILVHGHGSEPKAGSSGILINRNGSFLLKKIEVKSLR
jgi:uncharacterized membrane protein